MSSCSHVPVFLLFISVVTMVKFSSGYKHKLWARSRLFRKGEGGIKFVLFFVFFTPPESVFDNKHPKGPDQRMFFFYCIL